MARDHFIARTYLRHFAGLDGRLYVYRKSGGQPFPCNPADICTEWDGDGNPTYFADWPEMLGDFRKLFEPHWNEAVEAFEYGKPNSSHKLAVAGYLANLMACTPTRQRVGADFMRAHAVGYLGFDARMRRMHGKADAIIENALEMVKEETLTLDVDPNYPKAIATRGLPKTMATAYNQDWLVVRNSTDVPFITSGHLEK